MSVVFRKNNPNDAETVRYLGILKSRLAKLDTQLRDLRAVQEERDTVFSAIKALERLLSNPQGQPSPVIPPRDAPAHLDSEKPKHSNVWEGAILAFDERNTDLSLEDIRLAMCQMGWKLEGRPGREKIRGAMGRHPDVFERLGAGRYRLKQNQLD